MEKFRKPNRRCTVDAKFDGGDEVVTKQRHVAINHGGIVSDVTVDVFVHRQGAENLGGCGVGCGHGGGVGGGVGQVLLDHIATSLGFSSSPAFVVLVRPVGNEKPAHDDDETFQNGGEHLKAVLGAPVSWKRRVNHRRVPVLPLKAGVNGRCILYALVKGDNPNVGNEEDTNEGPRHQRDGDAGHDDGRKVDLGHHAHSAFDKVSGQFFVSASTLLDKTSEQTIANSLPGCQVHRFTSSLSEFHFKPSTRARISLGRT